MKSRPVIWAARYHPHRLRGLPSWWAARLAWVHPADRRAHARRRPR